MKLRHAFLGAALLASFIGLFWSAYHRSPVHQSSAKGKVLSVGTAGDYSYVISSLPGQAARKADFTPSVTNDDTEVITVLRAVMKASYPKLSMDSVQPMVEVIGERQYITFAGGGVTTVFEINREKKGLITGVRFWQD
jgi:hypothetical protein